VRRIEIESDIGITTPGEVDRAILLLNDARIDLAMDENQRTAILEASVPLLMRVEQQAQIKYDVGIVGKVEYLQAKANRLSGELELHKAKEKANREIARNEKHPTANQTKSVPQTAIDPELLDMLKARQEALSEVVDILPRNLGCGTSTIEIVYRTIFQLHEANLELAVNADERIAVIEANLQVLKSLEVVAKASRDAGGLSESDYLLTVANRLGGEIELRKVKR